LLNQAPSYENLPPLKFEPLINLNGMTYPALMISWATKA